MHRVHGTGTVVRTQRVRDVPIYLGAICTACGVDAGLALRYWGRCCASTATGRLSVRTASL